MRASFQSLYATLILTVCLPLFTYASPPDLQRYIVVVYDHAVPQEVATEIAQKANGRVGYVFEHVIKGFSIAVPEQALNGILHHPKVSYVEDDIPINAFVQQLPTGVERIYADLTALDIDGNDNVRVDVDVAVLDTGIDMEHADLNVIGGANCLYHSGGPPHRRSYFCDESLGGDDDHYHGTHVAGTIAALDNNIGVVGVAPGARLWAVKVLDAQGSGSLSGIIAGIDWVVAQGDIEVINMSLGGSGSSSAMNQAIDSAFNSGVTVVVAAGNSNADSTNFTPANAPKAITVSALADFDGLAGYLGAPTCRSDQDDTLAGFSNWGAEVDIAAPGVCILSTYPIERGGYGTISGTSMASPHVAGAAALLASHNHGPQMIWDTLINSGNYNWLDDSGDGILEPLLDISSSTFSPKWVLQGGGGNNPPSALFNSSCSLLACSFDATTSSDSDGSITSYHWDFGDGNTGSGVNISHSYAVEGTYNIVLTVTDDDSAIGEAQAQVHVSDVNSPTLLTSSSNNGSTWTATVYYETNDELNGVWSSGAGSCSANTCTLSGIRKQQSNVEFVSDQGETVTVYKP
ncbi:S8 family serine peptidase [Motilimonas eburnea]|uniref:S8 family serine peptidase n=1 Tax=Motilimonas eburnea TaxID=1737488 RepID=UPI001E5163F1|nr:S8 family serine peptidase [Motilimonas eburnea]MCE2572367.1 S8 family serine peptidase [Motilimonas eburnea]